MGGSFIFGVAAHDDATGIKIVVQGFGFPQKFRAEEDVIHPKGFTCMERITHRDRRFDDNGGLCVSLCGAGPDELQNGFHSGTVKIIGLGVVVCGDSQNDEIGIGIGGCAVCCGGQVQRALSGFRFGQVLFNIIILNGRTKPIDGLRLFLPGTNGRDFMMLGKKHRQRKPHITHASNSNFIGALNRNGFPRLLYKHFREIKIQNGSKRLQLVNGRLVYAVFQIGKNGAVHSGLFGELNLRKTKGLPLCNNSFCKKGEGESSHRLPPTKCC